MIGTTFKMQAKAWRYPGISGWHFLTLPKKESAKIKAMVGVSKKPYGSISVVATIGKTSWKTSIFPEKETNTYALPLKANVRKKEKIEVGENVRFQIEI